MELVTHDSLEAASQRAYTAFRRIGRVKEYNSETHVAGRIFVDGWPAEVRVEWLPYREEQVRVDIAATSQGDLSRAADAAMYRFADAFKQVTSADFVPPGRKSSAAIVSAVVAAFIAIGLAAAYFLQLPPFSG